jgi:A/G-specific adenine glycosylase
VKNSWESWSEQRVADFQQVFLKWYEEEHRNLPWRADQNPYRIWISEIMLQQTRVDTVIGYFYRFMERFPTIQALAQAEDEVLLKTWEGLGYYSRARNLKIAAQQIVEKFDGKMPGNLADIQSLKGIGPYTSGAIASIAFGLPEPAIDGNVMRVTSRLFEIDADIAKSSSRKIFDEAMRKIISHEFPGEFNQAMMDLGSAICTPTSPSCNICPIQSFCVSYAEGTQLHFPVKSKKMKAKPMYYLAFAAKDEDGAYYLEQRPDTGLLANMWTFPLVEVSKERYTELSQHSEHGLNKEFSLPNEIAETVWQTKPTGEITHIFSHLKWHILVYEGIKQAREDFTVAESLEKYNENNVRWVTGTDFQTLVFPKPQIKMWDLLKKHSDKITDYQS